MDGHNEGRGVTLRVGLHRPRHPVGAGAAPQTGAGGVEVAVVPVRSVLPLVVAVVLTSLTISAPPPALLETGHLPDEVHGQVGALTVAGLAPAALGGAAGDDRCDEREE